MLFFGLNICYSFKYSLNVAQKFSAATYPCLIERTLVLLKFSDYHNFLHSTASFPSPRLFSKRLTALFNIWVITDNDHFVSLHISSRNTSTLWLVNILLLMSRKLILYVHFKRVPVWSQCSHTVNRIPFCLHKSLPLWKAYNASQCIYAAVLCSFPLTHSILFCTSSLFKKLVVMNWSPICRNNRLFSLFNWYDEMMNLRQLSLLMKGCVQFCLVLLKFTRLGLSSDL